MMSLCAFMEKAKARIKKYDKAIENYNRTIELDDANSTRYCE
jgi:trehalose/maltose hydrolase-like predicted phosphorylase